MKRFHFPLRPVAILRAHRELQARQALAFAVGVLGRAEQAAESARVRAAELEQAIAGGRAGVFHSDQQAAFLQDYRRQRTAEAEALRQVEAARAEVSRCRQNCIEANRRLKIVNRLEERARAVHRADTLRAEQNEIDERSGYAAAARRTPS